MAYAPAIVSTPGPAFLQYAWRQGRLSPYGLMNSARLTIIGFKPSDHGCGSRRGGTPADSKAHQPQQGVNTFERPAITSWRAPP